VGSPWLGSLRQPQIDLVAICWLVESAKANVIEFEQEQDLQAQSSRVVQ
jgi:hypothetical protein